MRKLNAQIGLLDQVKDMGLQTIQFEYSDLEFFPKDGDLGVIGFLRFEDAEIFAAKFGGDVGEFFKKDDWELWQHHGTRNYCYHYEDYLSDLGDDFESIDKGSNCWYADALVNIAKDFDGDFASLESLIADIKLVIKKVEDSEEDDVIVVNNFKYFKTCKSRLMTYSENSNTHTIGVVLQKSTLE